MQIIFWLRSFIGWKKNNILIKVTLKSNSAGLVILKVWWKKLENFQRMSIFGKFWLDLNGVVFCILQFYISHIIFQNIPHCSRKTLGPFKVSWKRIWGRDGRSGFYPALTTQSLAGRTPMADSGGLKKPFPKQGSFQCFLPRAWSRVNVGASAAAGEQKHCRVALSEKGAGRV